MVEMGVALRVREVQVAASTPLGGTLIDRVWLVAVSAGFAGTKMIDAE